MSIDCKSVYWPATGGPRIAEGQTVWLYGHEFIATDVQYTPDPEHAGYDIMRYTGVCTASARNDAIRHTGYNGGTYGYRVQAKA